MCVDQHQIYYILTCEGEEEKSYYIPKKAAVAPKGITIVETMRSAKARETKNQLVTFCKGRSRQTAKQTRTFPRVPATTKTRTQINDQLKASSSTRISVPFNVLLSFILIHLSIEGDPYVDGGVGAHLLLRFPAGSDATHSRFL